MCGWVESVCVWPSPTGWVDPLGLAKCLPRCTDNKLQGPKNETEMARELSNQKSIIFSIQSIQSIQGYINFVELLQGWYEVQCNGIWEHSFGIEVVNIDNPGWKVKITGASLKRSGLVSVERDESDWIRIAASDVESQPQWTASIRKPWLSPWRIFTRVPGATLWRAIGWLS